MARDPQGMAIRKTALITSHMTPWQGGGNCEYKFGPGRDIAIYLLSRQDWVANAVQNYMRWVQVGDFEYGGTLNGRGQRAH